MSEFHGIFPATITPMTPQGRFDEEAFRKVLEFNIRAGAHGFWLAGGTGESVLLDDEENKRIAEIAADQTRGRAVNIMHVGAATTARAALLAEHAARVGVESICCVPPFFYSRSDEEIVEHYRAVGAAANLPLFVYNLPSSTGVEITPELMQKIQQGVPQVKGLKHSSPNFGNVRAFVEMGLSCFIGSANLMLPALTVGACGCVDGPPNYAPELWVEIWNAYQAGDLKRAEAAQRRAIQAWNLATKFNYFASVKALVGARIGVDCGVPRAPGSPLTAAEREQLYQELEALELQAVNLD
jgi:dihydrodipicolinate synthase/N-acetylneuraminate lyase